MITQAELKDRLTYDPDTGLFVWKTAKRITDRGRVAGYINKPHIKEYIGIRLDKHYLAHRLAWLYMTGEWPIGAMDHIDGDGKNNKWSNLRCVTPLENNRNLRKASNNTSGFTGVCWHEPTKKWQARIVVNKKTKSLGLYHTPEDAALVRKNAEISLGFHPNHGSDRPFNVQKKLGAS